MIVVDTNVIAYRFIAGEKTTAAVKIEQMDEDWRVPYLWRFEYLNVLSTLTKNSIINETQSITIYRNTFSFLHGREQTIDPEKVITFSIELLAKITFLQEAPKMEIAKLIWYKELVFY